MRAIVEKTCQLCGKTFQVLEYEVSRGHGKYCSRKCSTTVAGLITSFYTSRRGEDNFNWRGGKTIDGRGYTLIFCLAHPYASLKGYVREHRLVMEKHLGRILTPEENIHHINSIKSDNRIENLMLFPSNSEHTKYHNQLRSMRKKSGIT